MESRLVKDTTLGSFTQKVTNPTKCPHVKEPEFTFKTHHSQFTHSVSENNKEGFVDLQERIDEKIEEAFKRGERSYSILVEPNNIEEEEKDENFEMEDAELQDYWLLTRLLSTKTSAGGKLLVDLRTRS